MNEQTKSTIKLWAAICTIISCVLFSWQLFVRDRPSAGIGQQKIPTRLENRANNGDTSRPVLGKLTTEKPASKPEKPRHETVRLKEDSKGNIIPNVGKTDAFKATSVYPDTVDSPKRIVRIPNSVLLLADGELQLAAGQLRRNLQHDGFTVAETSESYFEACPGSSTLRDASDGIHSAYQRLTERAQAKYAITGHGQTESVRCAPGHFCFRADLELTLLDSAGKNLTSSGLISISRADFTRASAKQRALDMAMDSAFHVVRPYLVMSR